MAMSAEDLDNGLPVLRQGQRKFELYTYVTEGKSESRGGDTRLSLVQKGVLSATDAATVTALQTALVAISEPAAVHVDAAPNWPLLRWAELRCCWGWGRQRGDRASVSALTVYCRHPRNSTTFPVRCCKADIVCFPGKTTPPAGINPALNGRGIIIYLSV